MLHTFSGALLSACAVLLGFPEVVKATTPGQLAFVPLTAPGDVGLHFIDTGSVSRSGDVVRLSLLEVSNLGREGEPRLSSGLTAQISTWQGSCAWGEVSRAKADRYLDDSGRWHDAPAPPETESGNFAIAGTAPAVALTLACGGKLSSEPNDALTIAGAISMATKKYAATSPTLFIAPERPRAAAYNLFSVDELPHRYSQVFTAAGRRDIVDWASLDRTGSFASITSIRALPPASPPSAQIERLTTSFDCEKRIANVTGIEYFQSNGTKFLEVRGASFAVGSSGPLAEEMDAACSRVEPKTQTDLRNLLGR
jgi:hypothetical protein